MEKSEPLPPAGYIRLDEGFAILKLAALGPPPTLDSEYGPLHSAYGEQSDALSEKFIADFNRHELGAEVYSENGTRHAIANDTFNRTTFPSLLLHHPAIPSGLGGPLSNYVGGIICLQKRGFDVWAKRWIRDYLLEELRYGRVSLDNARVWGSEVGIDSLEGNPAPGDFDPMEETYWTLAMTVAWIAWRRSAKVREHSTKYREKCSYFHFGKWRVGFEGPIHEGWQCDSRRAATLSSLMLDEALENSFVKMTDEIEQQQSTQLFTVKESRENLWRRLQSGELLATGKLQFSVREKIDPFSWQDLEIYGDSEKREYVSPRNDLSENARLHEVTVKTSDVLALWPESDPKTKYFIAWLHHEIDLAHRELDKAWKSIDAKAAANIGFGYHSGARIIACIRSIADTTGQLADKSFQKAGETTKSLDHYSLANKALSKFLSVWAAKTPALVTSANGDAGALNKANVLVAQIQADLATTTELARLSIQSSSGIPESKGNTNAAKISLPSNRPPELRAAAIKVLKSINPALLSGKRDALLAEVNSQLVHKISKDTLRRALVDLYAEV